MNFPHRQTGGRSTELKTVVERTAQEQQRDGPSLYSRGHRVDRGLRIWLRVFSVCVGNTNLCLSQKWLPVNTVETLSDPDTPHLKTEYTRPGTDSAGREDSRHGKVNMRPNHEIQKGIPASGPLTLETEHTIIKSIVRG